MPLRLAAPADLDLRPLVWGLERSPWSERIELVLGETAEMAGLLASGGVDVALVPVHALAPMLAEVEIIPGMSRSASGPDPAVALVRTRPLREIESVAVSRRGHAAELLLRVLFAESGQPLRVEEGAASLRTGLEAAGALLLHGDEALSFPTPPGAARLDLSEAWMALTGRPIVWSLWAARPGAVDRDTYALLHTVRTRGRHDAPRIAERLAPGRGIAPDRLLEALETPAMYRLGTPQLEGLARLWRAAAERGWIEEPPAPRFLPLSEGSACHAKAEVLRALKGPAGGGSAGPGGK